MIVFFIYPPEMELRNFCIKKVRYLNVLFVPYIRGQMYFNLKMRVFTRDFLSSCLKNASNLPAATKRPMSVYQTDSKYSNIAARCRSHMFFVAIVQKEQSEL